MQIPLNFKTSSFNLKIRGFGSKTCGYSIILILKEIMTFYSERFHAFCWPKIQTLIKTKRNRKWKILHTLFERRILCLSSYKNRELKVKVWSAGARERKMDAFFLMFINSEGNFFNICFISMYSVLNKLSDYICLTY